MANRKQDNTVGCPKCSSPKITVHHVDDVELDGWNRPVQAITYKCVCGHVFSRRTRVV